MKPFLLSAIAFSISLATTLSVDAQVAMPTPMPAPTAAIQTGGDPAAAAAVQVWLAKLDDARGDETYAETAGILQRIASKADWAKLMAARAALGKLSSRMAKDMKFMQTLPGAPMGQYVVLQYSSSFENRKIATETVTAALDTDGQWKVAGYFVK